MPTFEFGKPTNNCDRIEPEDDGVGDFELQAGGERWRPEVASDRDAVGGCGDVGEDGSKQSRGNEMSDHVWVSIAASKFDSELGFGWPKAEFSAEERVSLGNQLATDIGKGLSLPAQRFPETLETHIDMDVQAGAGHGKRLPSLLPDYVRWLCPVISLRVVEVLQSCDLGETNFYPVKMFRHDGESTYPQEFRFLNIGNSKKSVDVRQSTGVRAVMGSTSVFRLDPIEDDELVVGANTLSGPDIWIDPALRGNPFFVSGKLYSALANSGLADALQLKRCLVSQ